MKGGNCETGFGRWTGVTHANEIVLEKIRDLYEALFRHDGYGEMKIEIRILKRGQKEIIIHCGKQYRYVVDFKPGTCVRETRNETRET